MREEREREREREREQKETSIKYVWKIWYEINAMES